MAHGLRHFAEFWGEGRPDDLKSIVETQVIVYNLERLPVTTCLVIVSESPLGGSVRMKFTVTLDREEGGLWVVECPAIPGCVSQGTTRQEAIEAIREAS